MNAEIASLDDPKRHPARNHGPLNGRLAKRVGLIALAAALLLNICRLAAHAQTAAVQVVYTFPAPGIGPGTDLARGPDGSFYGTTDYGGSSNNGTVFKMTPSGVWTTLVSFDGAKGAIPNRLTLGGDGYFYGTTREGGS